MAAMGFGFGYVRATLIVPGDPAASMNLVAANPDLWRQGIAAYWLANLAMLPFGTAIFVLFRRSSERLATLFLLAIGGSAAVALVSSMFAYGALAMLDPATTFSFGPQPTLALLCLRLNGFGQAATELFWGILYFAFGAMVVRTRRMPAILGWGLMLMGGGYTLNCFTKLLIPGFEPGSFTQIAITLGAIGGIPTLLWMLVRGVRDAEVPPSPVIEHG